MLSQNQSRYLTTIGFALLALLFASDLLLKPPKELVLLAIDCISALYQNRRKAPGFIYGDIRR